MRTTMKRQNYMKRTPMKRGKAIRRRGTVARARARRLRQFGTKARTDWWRQQPCVCEGKHPECQGSTDPAHVISRAAGGKAEHIQPMSRGCHQYQHDHGWRVWEAEVAIMTPLDADARRFVVLCESGPRFDSKAAAAWWATQGPDAPGVSS